MEQTPNSHANYESATGTPLQARIEATVTCGLGYSDRVDSAKSSLYKPDTRSLYISDDDPQNLQTSLLSLEVRSGANITYLTINQPIRRQESFFYPNSLPTKNRGLLGRLGDRLRLFAATAEMSFASLSETRPYFEGSSFTQDVTPRDEGLKPLPHYPKLNKNQFPLPEEGPLSKKEEYIIFVKPDPDAALRRMLERAEFEEQPNWKPASEPQDCWTPDSGRIIYSDIPREKVGFEEPQTCDPVPAQDVVTFIGRDGSRVSVTMPEPQTCEWRPVPDDDSNLTHLPQPFVEEQQNSPNDKDEDRFIIPHIFDKKFK